MIKTISADEQLARISNPMPIFKLFVYDDDKFSKWQSHLLNDELHVSDEHRHPGGIMATLREILFGAGLNITYEIGDFEGIIGFLGVIPGFRCNLTWQLWDRSRWGLDAVKQAKGLMKFIMDEFDLKRIGTRTADPKVKRLAEMLGFKAEGILVNDFKWEGKLLDVHVLGMTRPDGGDNG